MKLTADLLEGDIVGLDGQFRIAPGCHETIEAWKKLFRCLPSEFFQRLCGGVQATCRVDFCLRCDGTGSCRLLLHNDDGNRIGSAERSFDFAGGSVRHDGMSIEKSYQGRGIAKTLIRNSVRLYEQIGVQRVTIEAGLDVGGYTWARFGFRPTEMAWKALQPQLARSFQGIQTHLEPLTRKIVRAALQDEVATTIWRISDLAEGVDGVKLGCKLLAGTRWQGYLDLMDPDAMDRFYQYVGN